MLGALALLQALEHLAVASGKPKLGVAIADFAVVVLELAQASETLGLDVLDECLAGQELSRRGGGRRSGCLTLLSASLFQMGLHPLEVGAAVRAQVKRHRKRLPREVLPALAQGTDTLQAEAE